MNAPQSILTAHSCAPDARQAVREFHAAVVQPEMALVLFFCSSAYDREALAEEMTRLFTGVQVMGFGSAMIAALVLGLFNTLLRPILVLLTLPVTLLTLGLFLFVINALLFYFAASLLDGFRVNGFVAALIGSVLYSLCGLVIDAAMERMFRRR